MHTADLNLAVKVNLHYIYTVYIILKSLLIHEENTGKS